MSINEPTYYGPVATGGSTSTAIDTQTQGSLAVLVQQPCDQSPNYTSDTSTLVEEWKGPYTLCLSTAASATIGSTRAQVVTGNNWISRFSCPGNAADWILSEVDVRQLDAGDHAILRMTYRIEYGSDEPTPTEIPGTETWSVNWQPYNVSPYAFCANDDPNNARYAGAQNAGEQDVNSTAYAQHIKDCVQQPADSGQQLKRFYDYMNTTTGGKILTLNAMERRIMDKVLNDLSPTYHFPVVQRQRQYQDKSATLNFDATIGTSIDVAGSLPNSCPYEFDSRWNSWLKVGDSVQLSRKPTELSATTINTFTRTETWWGANEFDINFYGQPNSWNSRGELSGRWIVGKQ